MPIQACYSGPNPIKDEERPAIWRWAKENAIDQGMPIDKVGDMINDHFFGGQAPQKWINDILTGRKTPFRFQANEAWRAQYNRRQIIRQAQDMSKMQAMGPVYKLMRNLTSIPRDIETLGHFAVFPVSHGGDLFLNPAHWDIAFRGLKNAYAAVNPAYHARIEANLERDPMFDDGLRSQVDMGHNSHASGLISRFLGGSAERAWDMLKVMRFELWKRQMEKFSKPEMTSEQQLDLGRQIADWANHATGSTTKTPFGKYGGLLFGPKLTASKLSRLVADPLKTAKTFADWGNATLGEKAVARIRLVGATRYVGTLLGFLAINQGLNMALGSNQKVNVTDPTKSDYLQFKLGGTEAYLPGIHSEIRALGQMLATSWATSKQLRGQSRQEHLNDILGQYLGQKVTPAISVGKDVLTGQDWQGRPMPWSSDPGIRSKRTGLIAKPRLSWGEYAGSMGPIPLQGPIGYVYDKMRQQGASAMDATAIIKGIVLSALGATGIHVKEEPPAKKQTLSQAIARTRAAAQLQAR